MKNGIAGLIEFFNTLTAAVRFIDDQDTRHSLPGTHIQFDEIPNFVAPEGPQHPLSLQITDPQKIQQAAIRFLKTIFERVTEDKGGNIWYGLRLAVLQEYPEKLRQKNFYEMISQVNATFDEIDIYWAALLCRAVMGMIENSQVYPFLDTETTRTQSIQKLIEGVSSSDIISADNMMERINYLTKNPEIIDREKTRYRFEPLSQYAHVISQIHFFITESSHKLDPKTELKEFIQETKQKNPEIFTRMFEVGSIFNLEHTSIVHLMIQLLTSYVFENRSIERIQFCQNHYQPKLNCNNLMIEKKQGAKIFAADIAKKIITRGFANQLVNNIKWPAVNARTQFLNSGQN